MNKRIFKPPRPAEWLLQRLRNTEDSFCLLGDMEEDYNRIRSEKSQLRAKLWYWNQILSSFFPFIYFIDKDFVDCLGLKLTAGNTISKVLSQNSEGEFLVSE